MTEKEWDPQGEYRSVVLAVKLAVKLATNQEVLQVYKVKGRGGRFEVFILAKVDDGLVGVKALGVAT